MFLMILSVVAALMFLAISAIRVFRGGSRISFWSLLLLVIALGGSLLAVITEAAPLARPAAFGIIGALMVVGVVFLIIEWRRPGRLLSQSRGLLSIGTGVLLLVGILAAPFVSRVLSQRYPTNPAPASALLATTQRSFPNAEQTPMLDETQAISDADLSPRSASAVTPTATPFAEATPLPPRPTLIAPTRTHTPFVISTYVPVTATVVAQAVQCQGFVQNNLNLRTAPDTDAERLTTIPSGTVLGITGQNESGTWFQVVYETLSGWVSADYVRLGDSCGPLPLQNQ